MITDTFGNRYCRACGFIVHKLNKSCKSCGHVLIIGKKPLLYKRGRIKKQTEADRVRQEGRY